MAGMRAALAIATTFAAATAHADAWSKADTVLEVVALTTLGADYLQTRQIVRDGIETNPIIGRCGGAVHPDDCGRASPELYFLSVAAAHIVVMRLLPRTWRNACQGITIGFELLSVQKNLAWGYEITF